MNSILHRESIRLLYVLGLFGFIFFLLAYIDNLLLSLVIGFVVYYLLSPIVNILERKSVPRTLAIFVLYLVTTITFVSLCIIFIPLLVDQLRGLEHDLPSLRQGLTQVIHKFESRVQSILPIESFEMINSLGDWLLDQTSLYTSRLPGWISDSLTTLFLAPFLGFFMLRDGSLFKKQLLYLIPNNFFEMTMTLIYEMNHQIGSFIRARIVEALIVGAVTYIGLLLIGFPFAILVALFAAITNLIPYLGPVVGAIPPLLIILVNPGAALGSLGINLIAVTIVYLTAQLLDAFFIIPIVVAKIVNLHPITVILVIILGAQLLGILGMIISIPVTSLMKLVLNTIYHHTLRSHRPSFPHQS